MSSTAASASFVRSGRHWPWVIVGMLLMNVGVVTTTIVLALRHPVEIVPNYYDQALRWDELRGVAASHREGVAPAARTDASEAAQQSCGEEP